MSKSIHQAITNKARADKFVLVLNLPPVLKDLDSAILSPRTQEYIQEDALQFSVWGGMRNPKSSYQTEWIDPVSKAQYSLSFQKCCCIQGKIQPPSREQLST